MKACEYPSCHGTPECNGRGVCDKGVCQCTGNWAGSDCSIGGKQIILQKRTYMNE